MGCCGLLLYYSSLQIAKCSIEVSWVNPNRWTGPMCESLHSCSCWAVLQICKNKNMSSYSVVQHVVIHKCSFCPYVFKLGKLGNGKCLFFCTNPVIWMGKSIWCMTTVSHLEKNQLQAKVASWRGDTKALAIWERASTCRKVFARKRVSFPLNVLKKSHHVVKFYFQVANDYIFHLQQMKGP